MWTATITLPAPAALIELPDADFLNSHSPSHEDSLRLAVLSTGDGGAGRAGGRIVSSLGRCRARSNRAHGLSQSPHRRCAARVPREVPATGGSREHRRNQCRSHLASSFSEPEGVRTNVELQFVFRL